MSRAPGVKPFLRLAVFAALGLASVESCLGEEIVVTPGPQALAKAVERAGPGDTLLVKPGVYRERIRIGKPLTLRGEPGASIVGAEPLQAEWSPAGEGMDGVFVAELPGRPYGLLADGKFVAEIRHDRAQSEGAWHWRTLLAKGTPLSGFAQLRALWMYHPGEKKIYVRPEDGKAPGGAALSWLPSDRALVTVVDTRGVLVEGLAFAQGGKAVEVGEGASDVVLRRCRVESYEDTGILLGGGASRCLVEECSITRGALEEWQPSLKDDKANYEIWRLHKEVGRYDRVGVSLFRAGRGNRVLRNHLDRVFDGVCLGDYQTESLDKPLTDPDHGRGTEIAGNVIENTRDSGIELGAGCIEVEVHGNLLRRTHGGLRFKAPRIGPVFVHHNRMLEGAPFNIWFSMDAAPAEGYVYHNTVVGGERAAVEYSSFKKPRDEATPRWHFVNNLALGQRRGFFALNKGTPKPDFTASHNLSTGGGAPWPDGGSNDQGSRYGVSIGHDAEGRPALGSAAIDGGADLSAFREGKPLPGAGKDSVRGAAPDVGAFEAGVE